MMCHDREFTKYIKEDYFKKLKCSSCIPEYALVTYYNFDL